MSHNIWYTIFMKNLEQHLEDYLDYLEIEKNRSLKTRDNYDRYLRAFFSFGNVRSLRGITADLVRDFRLHLARTTTVYGKPLKKNTQSYYIISLRNFLKFLIKNGYHVLSPDIIELPRLSTRQIDILEYTDLERLLDAPDIRDLRGLRDKSILEMLFSTGLRISELCALDRYINFSNGEFTIRGKGEKLRIVFVSSRARDALAHYLEKRTDTEKALFISLTRSGNVVGRITPRAIQRLFRFYTTKAGIVDIRVTPHSLRHQFATDLLANGADLRSVQELLGHQNVTTTQIYTHVTNKELKNIHQHFHGKRRN